ncbi:MAG: GTPase Der [Phycisphaerae bacterium]|nr:GTPase Der [Phycisphaerae bacterium]
MLPVVAIVGRPNVGKSSLLNRIAGRMISIVDPTPGITRDRVSTICHHRDRYFELVDTGGYGIEDSDNLTEQVEAQIAYAIESAALVLFVVDARDGMVALDERVAELLRNRHGATPAWLLVNKIDAPAQDNLAADFFRLGFGTPFQVSAQHGRGIAELMDRIAAHLAEQGLGQEEESAADAAEPEMKIALVGKRNAGKSTFINAIAGGPRVIVSEVAGTTRDAVDVRFVRDGHSFLAIDTAGVRRRGSVKADVDFYSLHRAQRSIRRADVVLFMMDATVPVSGVDKRLGQYITEQFKPVILVINKYDLVKDRADSGDYADYLTEVLPGLEYAPVALTTASESRNVQSVLDLASSLFRQACTRVGTGQLNAVIEQISGAQGPGVGMSKGGQARIYYATQVAVRPPTIVSFMNDPRRVTPAFEKYLLNRFRESLPFPEVPMRLLFRARSGESAADLPKLSRRRRAKARGKRKQHG